ncbi:hypothetical protein [Vibrio vulnificus]|uniref:hypothetical protein n=1 Tax=Vibrio vulnificus TaxID=672 RepID=UPI001023E577|nr:hypothetical protein [Vibrio vulnificus]RZQ33200.1 hypothetical protein D8T38_18325 [Vibrio vulnificus]
MTISKLTDRTKLVSESLRFHYQRENATPSTYLADEQQSLYVNSMTKLFNDMHHCLIYIQTQTPGAIHDTWRSKLDDWFETLSIDVASSLGSENSDLAEIEASVNKRVATFMRSLLIGEHCYTNVTFKIV